MDRVNYDLPRVERDEIVTASGCTSNPKISMSTVTNYKPGFGTDATYTSK